jgi:large subunit ribosomal protein L3
MTTTGLIAKKVGMTRMMDPEGQKMLAVTLLKVEASKVTKILSPEKDGYAAIQIGYLAKKEKHLSKPDIHRLRKAGVEDNFARFKEFRTEGVPEGLEVGSDYGVSTFEGVTAVDVTGLTKGRGFQGTVRRYNTKTGRQTHGSRFHRRPGSLGQRATPGRVYKNKGMPGQMGTKQRTIQNLKVMDIDTEAGTIAVSGSIPGNRESFVIIKPSIKAK